jgi:beta-D-xylosidase 4
LFSPRLQVNVTNTGSVDSDDVVLGFLTPPGAGQNGVPIQQLFGFEVRGLLECAVTTEEPAVLWCYAVRHIRGITVRAIPVAALCPAPHPLQRVHIKAGETVTVYLAANGVSFTQVQEDGSRVAWPGEYVVRFGVKETEAFGMGFAEMRALAQ